MFRRSLVILMVIAFVLIAGNFAAPAAACPNDRHCCYSSYHDGGCVAVKRVVEVRTYAAPCPKSDAKIVNLAYVPVCGCRCASCCSGAGHCHATSCRMRNDSCRPVVVTPDGRMAGRAVHGACCSHAPCCADCGGRGCRVDARCDRHDCRDDFWCNHHGHKCHGDSCGHGCCGCFARQILFHDDCTGSHVMIPTCPPGDKFIVISR